MSPGFRSRHLGPARKQGRGRTRRRVAGAEQPPGNTAVAQSTSTSTPTSTVVAGRPVGWPGSSLTGELFITGSGDGLLLLENGEAEANIPGSLLGGAVHRDRVRVEIVPGPYAAWPRRGGRRRRPTARVAEILARGVGRFTGRLRAAPAGVVVEPDDVKLPASVPLEGPVASWREGAAVVAEMLPLDPARPERVAARIVATFAGPDAVVMEVERVLVREALGAEFPEPAAAQARATTPESLLVGDLVDLTDLPFVTIDPEDARDHDDAVCVLPARGRGASSDAVDVWVAIADVAQAAPSGSPLDAEARRRGLSVYLPDRVIPMLPVELSALACSLREGADRAALAVRVRLDPDGRQIGATEIVRAAIRSRAYLDYGRAARLLEGDARARRDVAPGVLDSVTLADRAARALRRRRLAGGSLDLDLSEACVILDAEGNVTAIRPRAPTPGVRDAYRLIEDLMLLANRAVARLLLARGAPGIYRVHERPAARDVERFARVARRYGVPIRPERASESRTLAAALASMQGKPFGEALAGLLLRALPQARYAPMNLGHFGLGFREYLHFTSPIRRYPDLVVHRVVRAVIGGARAAEIAAMEETEALAEAAATASARERRAMLVEREVGDLYAAWFMRDRVGLEADGAVSGLSPAGVFVRLVDPFVEGLVPLEDLPPDDWWFDAEEHRLRGRRTGRAFRLGDAVRVEVTDASVARRRVYLRLGDSTGRRGSGRLRPGGGAC